MDNFNVAHNLDTVARTDDVRLKELIPFSKMVVTDYVRKGLHEAGFVYPTVIQATAIPVGKSGLDLLVQSKTGTGKTLIFCTVILDAYKPNVQEPQSLIIVPTREVAVQVEQVLNKIGKCCPKFRAVYIIGGMDVAEDRKRLQGAKAIVGTPGRILHLIQNEVLNTSQIRIMVLDEADKMYSKNFRKDIEKIRRLLPIRKQIIACSATFENKLDDEIAKIMKNPLLISTDDRATLLLGIKQFVYELEEQKTSVLEMQLKLDGLKYIFGRVSFKQCIIFAGSQSRAESYSNYLEKDGWPCELISGAQDQKKRLEQFRKFLNFKTRILIATDLMSRGVDFEHVNLVINLELPEDSVSYLHRIGRAGRFGSHGVAISFVSSAKDQQTFKKLLSEISTGMHALKFPSKTNCEKGEKDVWSFDSFEDDARYFGLYVPDAAPKAPLASQEGNSFTGTLSESNHNIPSNNTSTLQQSSININTFLVNSQDSAVVVPPSTEFLQHPDACQKNKLISSDNQNTPCESLYDSSHQLITSNTIDDASSIAADSLRSSQQDVSRYQSVLMQKSAIPTLVEFLVDQQSSQDTHTKPTNEEVLNDSDKLIEAYEEIAQELKTCEESIKRRIKNLRGTYVQEKKKVDQSKKSGSGAESVYQSSLYWFEEMNFLDASIATRKSKNNFADNTLDDSVELDSTDDACTPPTPAKKPRLEDSDILINKAIDKIVNANPPVKDHITHFLSYMDSVLRDMSERGQFETITETQNILMRNKFKYAIPQYHASATQQHASNTEELHASATPSSSDNTRDSNIIFEAMSDADIFDEDDHTVFY